MKISEKIAALAASFTILGVTVLPYAFAEYSEDILESTKQENYTYETENTVCEYTILEETVESDTEEAVSADIYDPIITSEADVELIALVTIAEAESEDDMGKRLVIDTILNRVENENFPDTLHDVIYQKYHFSCVWNGRIEKCKTNSDVCALVWSELEQRTNNEVLFFQGGEYSKYGRPLFKWENHYFSGWEE